MENPDNENSCMLTYWQFGLNDNCDRKHLLNRVVLQYLDEPTFDQLRTKEQLGYVVFSRSRNGRDLLGAWILVQSAVKDCDYLRDRIQKHMARQRTKVAALTEEAFKTQVNAVLIGLKEKDKNMSEEFARMHGEIVTHKYNFDRQDENIELVQQLTLGEFKAHFEAMFFQAGCGNRLDMRYHSKKHLETPTGTEEAKPAEEAKTEGGAAEEAKAEASESEAEPEVDHSTEMKHASVAMLKKKMGLFNDVFQMNYVNSQVKL